MSDVIELLVPAGRILVAVGDLSILPSAGAHWLRIPIELTATWIERESQIGAPVMMGGDVYTETGGPLGVLAPVLFSLRGYQTHEELKLMLTTDQVLALDALHEYNDVVLLINLSGALLAGTDGVHPATSAQLRLRIPQAVWREQIERLGAELSVLIRVPLPLSEPSREVLASSAPGAATIASRAQAAARLREARSEFLDNRYDSSVRSCRLVLDNLAHLMPELAREQAGSTKPRSRSSAERWSSVYQSLRSLTSAAHHDDEVTTNFVWRRRDSEAILAITGSLVAWCLAE
jgi:hypothetical protein